MFSPGLGCHRSLGSGSASRTSYRGILSVLCWFFFFAFVCSWVLFCVPVLKPLQCLMTPALSCILSSTALLLLCHQFSSQLFICRRSNISAASLMENNSGLKMVDRSSFWTAKRAQNFVFAAKQGGKSLATVSCLHRFTKVTQVLLCHYCSSGMTWPLLCFCFWGVRSLLFITNGGLSESIWNSRSLDNLLWTVNQAKGASDCGLGTLVMQRIAPHNSLHVQVRLIKIQKQSMLLFTAKCVF